MAEFPALPIFTDAYLADTRHLTAAQHGAYLLLLMMAWRLPDCALPDDDGKLARWAAMDARTWRANKPAVLAFWKQGDDGLWRQGRLTDERKYVADLSSKNSQSAKARWLKTNKSPDANALPTQCQSDAPTPTPTPTRVSSLRSDSHSAFESWYRHYPHKVQRGAAERAFLRAIMQAPVEDLIEGVERYKRDKPQDRPWQNPATWLNGKGWLDQPAIVQTNRNDRNETSLSAHARSLTERIESVQRGESLFSIGGEPSGGNPVRLLPHGRGGGT